MLVRFGYVAMSMLVANASPSRTMTYKRFQGLADREAALRKLERIAAENLHNTLRLLKHNRAHDIRLYRMSSKLIPLATHQELADWDPFPALREDFAAVGDYAKRHGMRLSFHPDHFTVLSTTRKEVLESSKRDLNFHLRMLQAMGLDARAKNNIHIGGAYGNKRAAEERFVRHAEELPEELLRRLTLENDDKTFTAAETLAVCERLGLPMVLDIHHHQVKNEGEPLEELWPRIARTWETPYAQADASPDDPLPPKIHVSSPKSEKDIRGHADDIDVGPLLDFLRAAAAHTERLDVMIEAKHKDKALFKLMDDLAACEGEGVAIADQASVRIAP
ncbi:UV DNA damage repair endonuclease UvsE [Paenibacillus melissococcoides]|uniref:UV DNA damage repair endonuclease UvsE n=1 Tax=Paenibacillus melissococcoides TaxID=2912268 RepID=A0ABM9GBK6_9BACL|nr:MULTISPECIES: UV DNA damage repair endonuclease UvsE [Paenibacillus]MEB9892380.1 UV DNA damage repair endonuclease UvsE [Bacillus cereus]GIO81818.1 UV damage endonuclease UvsE [Paenibacillus dendritiformis]CAH8249044.1 UV DNA damage repair endonuclease UvsE [Paenibacillus melissococcoides]